jgi:hypothetical protein
MIERYTFPSNKCDGTKCWTEAPEGPIRIVTVLAGARLILLFGPRIADMSEAAYIEMTDQSDDDHKTSEPIKRGRCQPCDKYRELVVDPFCEDRWDYLNKHDT